MRACVAGKGKREEGKRKKWDGAMGAAGNRNRMVGRDGGKGGMGEDGHGGRERMCCLLFSSVK